MDVLEGLEVIVQGVPHQRLALQEPEDLFLGHLEEDGLAHVLPGDAAPASAVVHDGHLRLDVLVVEDLAVVTRHGAAGQLTHPPSGSRAHHLTVDSHALAGQGPSRFSGGGLSAAWGTSRFSPWTLPHAAGGFGAWGGILAPGVCSAAHAPAARPSGP